MIAGPRSDSPRPERGRRSRSPRLLYINIDSPILEEMVQYHQASYPDVYAEEVAETIRHTFGDIAVAKVTHSQKLMKEVSLEVLDRAYRDGKALMALMGRLAEESLIHQRLSRYGRRKVA